jgi:hypothetical protein
MLESGHATIGMAAVGELLEVAKRELATQGALSREAIAKGGEAATERMILEAWRDYYVAALPTLREIPLDGGILDPGITRAQAEVRAAAERVLATLR